MMWFHSFWAPFLASELPGLLGLGAVVLVQRGGGFPRAQRWVYSPAALLPALPSLMLASAVLFGHDHGLVAVGSLTADRLSWLPLCLYLLQFPAGFLTALFLTLRFGTKHVVFAGILSVSLLLIQMLLSFPVMLLASMAITGDFL
jgi:hypothetical protein